MKFTRTKQCINGTATGLHLFILIWPTLLALPVRSAMTGKINLVEQFAMTIESEKYAKLLMSYYMTVLTDPYHYSLREIKTFGGSFTVESSTNELTRRFIAWVYRSFPSIVARKWRTCCRIFGITYVPVHVIRHNDNLAEIHIDFEAQTIKIKNLTTGKDYVINVHAAAGIDAATILQKMMEVKTSIKKMKIKTKDVRLQNLLMKNEEEMDKKED